MADDLEVQLLRPRDGRRAATGGADHAAGSTGRTMTASGSAPGIMRCCWIGLVEVHCLPDGCDRGEGLPRPPQHEVPAVRPDAAGSAVHASQPGGWHTAGRVGGDPGGDSQGAAAGADAGCPPGDHGWLGSEWRIAWSCSPWRSGRTVQSPAPASSSRRPARHPGVAASGSHAQRRCRSRRAGLASAAGSARATVLPSTGWRPAASSSARARSAARRSAQPSATPGIAPGTVLRAAAGAGRRREARAAQVYDLGIPARS